MAFRKSKKIGSFRVTASKSGLSVSAGRPGARVSVNTKGEVRRTVGVPGTGIYDTKVVAKTGRAPARGLQPGPGSPGYSETRVETQLWDATYGRRDLLFGDATVTRLKIVGVAGKHAEIATFCGLVRNQEGWTRGIRAAVLAPGAGEEYTVYVLAYPQDNPALFGKHSDGSPKGTAFGRLGKADSRAWAAAFGARSIGVVIYLDATPGAEVAEVRFFADALDGDDGSVQTDLPVVSQEPVSTEDPPPEPLPPAAWYPDPHEQAGLRWWDGSQWTNHVSGLPTK